MEILWFGLLTAGVVSACILLILVLRQGGLPDGVKLFFGTLKLKEDVYEPLLLLEELGYDCLRRIGEKQIELIFDIDKNIPAKLYGDKGRIRQVMTNLLDNAIQFAEKGYVRLLVKIYPVVENEMLEMYVSVKDTGRGISRKKMDRLFSFHGKIRKKGELGNGLYASQRLIEKMGGEIRAKSEEDKGSEFWFSIQQRIADTTLAAVIKLPENGRTPRVSAKLSNPYREEALMSLLNMYKVSYIPYDILQDVGMMVDYLFTDHGVYYEAEEEMLELVRCRENLCVLENPLRDHRKLEGVTIVYRPFFSLNFCRFLNHEQAAPKTNEVVNEKL